MRGWLSLAVLAALVLDASTGSAETFVHAKSGESLDGKVVTTTSKDGREMWFVKLSDGKTRLLDSAEWKRGGSSTPVPAAKPPAKGEPPKPGAVSGSSAKVMAAIKSARSSGGGGVLARTWDEAVDRLKTGEIVTVHADAIRWLFVTFWPPTNDPPRMIVEATNVENRFLPAIGDLSAAIAAYAPDLIEPAKKHANLGSWIITSAREGRQATLTGTAHKATVLPVAKGRTGNPTIIVDVVRMK